MLLKDLLPAVFYVAAYDVRRYCVTLPSGKPLVFTPSTEYITSDQEEIEFLSKQKGLGFYRSGDSKERFLRYIAARYDESPTLQNMIGKTREDFELFVLQSTSESTVVDYLRNRGYNIELSAKIEELEGKINEKDNTSDEQESVVITNESNIKEPFTPKGKPTKSK